MDFFAVYIIPTDDWYILPYEVIGDRDANVYLRPGSKEQKYEKYREAWHLLLEACKGAGPVDIHGCCEETAEESALPQRHRDTEESVRNAAILTVSLW